MVVNGFVGPAYRTQSVNASAEECFNLYLETQESPGASPRQVYYGTPGLTLLMTLPTLPLRGAFYQDGRSFAVGGDVLYETTSGAPVAIGNVGNDGRPVTLWSNGAQGHQLYVVSNLNGFILDLNTQVFGMIADANFPNGSALMGAFQDGYFLVLTPIQFQISKPFDGSTWNGLDFAKRNIASDNLAAFLPNHRELILAGTLTTEIWADSGATSFPYAPLAGVFLEQGIGAPFSIARVDNSVGWIAVNRDGTRQVMLINQLAPQRISTHAVEASLDACPDITDFIGFCYQEQGHLHYVLTSAKNKLTWVYDASEQQWHKRSYLNTATGQDEAILASCHAQSFGQHWVGDRKSGNLYQQALGVYADNGNPIRSLRRVPHLANELHGLIVDQLQLDAEVGVGLPLNQGADPQVLLRLSKDGGHTYVSERWTSLGLQGQYGRRAIWNRCGFGRNFVIELSMTDPVRRAWQNLYMRARSGRT
jgi:hypothetical protein